MTAPASVPSATWPARYSSILARPSAERPTDSGVAGARSRLMAGSGWRASAYPYDSRRARRHAVVAAGRTGDSVAPWSGRAARERRQHRRGRPRRAAPPPRRGPCHRPGAGHDHDHRHPEDGAHRGAEHRDLALLRHLGAGRADLDDRGLLLRRDGDRVPRPRRRLHLPAQGLWPPGGVAVRLVALFDHAHRLDGADGVHVRRLRRRPVRPRPPRPHPLRPRHHRRADGAEPTARAARVPDPGRADRPGGAGLCRRGGAPR